MSQAEDTKKRIEECAMKEFLEKGFNGASLRKIVHNAGVTTGAFYKYYSSKESLFEGLVGECVEHIYKVVDENYNQFVKQDLENQTKNMQGNSVDLTTELLDYIYEHHDVIRLVLTASEGTKYSDFLHNLAKKEEDSTIRFAELMRSEGSDVSELDRQFVHMVSSGFFSAAFEIVLHNMDKNQARKRIDMLDQFYTAGWEKILGAKFLQ